VTRDELASWLRAYGAAWETRDGEAAAALFAEYGIYCWGPLEPPLRGSEILGIDGSRGFARWWCTYAARGSRTELDGVFVLGFAGDRLCTQLQEWWLGHETPLE
jgi:hypothetical protein